MTQKIDGILLFAHGSRDPLWRLPIEAVAQRIRAQSPGTPVACAYLELCEPDLPTAAAQLIAQCDTHNATLRLFPLFLGIGKHAREDLPLLVADLRLQHPAVTFELMATAGSDERVTHLLADMALENTV